MHLTRPLSVWSLQLLVHVQKHLTDILYAENSIVRSEKRKINKNVSTGICVLLAGIYSYADLLARVFC